MCLLRAKGWPSTIVEALAQLGVDPAQALRGDGRLSVRLSSGRVDIHRVDGDAVVLSAVLFPLLDESQGMAALVERALHTAQPSLAPFQPTLCVASEGVLLQSLLEHVSRIDFAGRLAEFVSELRRRRAGEAVPARRPAAPWGQRHVFA